MPDEPNLDEPGRPWGNLPQTKRQNCFMMASKVGGFDNVTDAHLKKWELTRDEYNTFRMDDADAERHNEIFRRFDEIMPPEFKDLPPE
jgi:hypothetical protein